MIEDDSILVAMVDVLHNMPEHLLNGCFPQTTVVYLAYFVHKILGDFVEVMGVNIT